MKATYTHKEIKQALINLYEAGKFGAAYGMEWESGEYKKMNNYAPVGENKIEVLIGRQTIIITCLSSKTKNGAPVFRVVKNDFYNPRMTGNCNYPMSLLDLNNLPADAKKFLLESSK